MHPLRKGVRARRLIDYQGSFGHHPHDLLRRNNRSDVWIFIGDLCLATQCALLSFPRFSGDRNVPFDGVLRNFALEFLRQRTTETEVLGHVVNDA